MDYRADHPYPKSNMPGLIADNVSRREEPNICLPIRSLDSLGYARTYGAASSPALSLNCHLRREQNMI